MRQVDISGYITGAAQPKITQANLNRIPVLVGSTEILGSFESVCCPMLDQVAVLERVQSNLRHYPRPSSAQANLWRSLG